MVNLEPKLDLCLLVPTKWKHPLKTDNLSTLTQRGYRTLQGRVLFSGNYWRYFFLRPSLYLRQLKPDIVHVEQELASLALFQATLMRRLLFAKASIVCFMWQDVYRTYPFYRQWIEHFNLRQIDHAIAGNKKALEVLRRKGYKGGVTVMPQFGVDEELFRKLDASRLRATLGLDGPVVGYVGRFDQRKGIRNLIEAIGKAEIRIQLLLVGAGKIEPELRRLGETLGIQKQLVFAGVIPTSELPLYFNAMDILVLPSITMRGIREQFGHVLIEAMSCQLPVVGSDSGEIPNVVGNAGVIFRQGDSEELQQKLVRLLRDPGLRRELGRLGRERVLKEYTHRMIAEKTLRIYRQLLVEPG